MGGKMGCLAKGDEAANSTNKRINEEIKKSRTRLEQEVKILLLGAGESGKSTIVKQMRIIHENGFSQQELMNCREQIISHIKNTMHSLINQIREWELETNNEDESNIKIFMDWYDTKCGSWQIDEKNANLLDVVGPNSTPIHEIINILWNSEIINAVMARCHEFYIIDSARYYFDNIKRICDKDYIPNEADFLRVRVKTSGIVETRFWYNSLHIRMVDVGGQRSERKKWIHCFEGVTAIIFCASLSAYATTLLEDDETNRMIESLNLFESICSSNWFERSSIILFLNKTDLLEPTLKLVGLNHCFPEYEGENNFEEASVYIRDEFRARNRNTEKIVFIHYTCATDTDIVKKVFEDVTNMIINQNLKLLGFL